MNVCTICFDDIDDQASSVDLNCGHNFHGSCIVPWLQMQGRRDCPLCRDTPENDNDNVSETDENASSDSEEESELTEEEELRLQHFYDLIRKHNINRALEMSRRVQAPSKLKKMASTYRKWCKEVLDCRKKFDEEITKARRDRGILKQRVRILKLRHKAELENEKARWASETEQNTVRYSECKKKLSYVQYQKKKSGERLSQEVREGTPQVT